MKRISTDRRDDTLLSDEPLRRRVGELARRFVSRKYALPTVIDAFDKALFPDSHARPGA